MASANDEIPLADVGISFTPPDTEPQNNEEPDIYNGVLNDVHVWVWNKKTGEPIPYYKLRIWANMGRFTNMGPYCRGKG